VYRNPIERERELTAIYADEAPAPEVLRSLHDTQLPAMRTQARVLHDVLGRNGSGLEVGSYVGGFLAAARERGLQFEGVDVNAQVNAFTRSLGFPVHDGDLASVPRDRRFDAIAIWNTFDQLADPRGAVKVAHDLLSPGGVLVVRVPNGAYYAERRHDRSAWPLLAQNNLLTFPYRWGFTEQSLERLLETDGFTLVCARGDVLVPIADEWTRPWAAQEEREIKRALRVDARESTDDAPWLEIYARR
jgi:SAM-dependent methyltransferase